ncbi:MAG: hypothetical protein ABIB47_05600, partial [Candidatus Woesearchaeota archaeon]
MKKEGSRDTLVLILVIIILLGLSFFGSSDERVYSVESKNMDVNLFSDLNEEFGKIFDYMEIVGN